MKAMKSVFKLAAGMLLSVLIMAGCVGSGSDAITAGGDGDTDIR